ncbi:hypothetical protein RF11_11507 [Thelohanellus kitauei]|uniref:Uncharacterized protein n=1 Tax=Thelohanellus kitauei TaxID=669202 RepID=A0A0C2MVJ6_THEKT|nr:hypothetical protein RF11_11507 [Thelohanellus kitauei]
MNVLYFLFFLPKVYLDSGFMGSSFGKTELKSFYEESDFVIGGYLNSPLKSTDDMVYAQFTTTPTVFKNSQNGVPKLVYFGRLSRFEPWPSYDQWVPVIIFGSYHPNDKAYVSSLSNIDPKVGLEKFVSSFRSSSNSYSNEKITDKGPKLNNTKAQLQ